MFSNHWRGAGGAMLGLLLFGVDVFVAALLLSAYTQPSSPLMLRAAEEFTPIEKQQMKQALIGAIRIPTVSFSEEEQNITALAEIGEYIREAFPRVFSSDIVHHELVGNYSHLFTVRGSDQTLMPYMMLAHLDVVPAPPEGWDIPPFSGEEHDGYIYGRGTLDDKNCAIGVLQALELQLKWGYKPKRSFYIGLGHDEEISGRKGARKIVETLQSRGVKLLFVIDEGLAVVDGVLLGIKRPVALVGITEKGAMTLNLTVNQPPGHSSMPPRETAIGILAKAVSRLEKNPMPNLFGKGPEADTFKQLSGEFAFPLNLIMENLWFFSPIVSRVLEQIPSGNAMVRTTTAPTIFNAGIKSNVIPQTAQATINFRIHPAQTVEEVLNIVRETINDWRVNISVLDSFDPLPVSPYDDSNFGYQTLKGTIESVFSGVPVAPGVCTGNTDSRHYVGLSDSVYRFSPVQVKSSDLNRMHGLNERISVDGFERVTRFYCQLIQNSDSVADGATHGL